MPLLSEDEIRAGLGRLAGWERHDNEIRRTYTFPSFAAAIEFVNRVARLADAADHHPDIDIRYTKVTLALSSHDAGGLTERDVSLAEAIDS